MAQRNIKARYHVRGPKKEAVTYTKCEMNDDKNVVMKTVTEERECYTVLFPQGHSIRVTSYDELQRMGYHLKPRMVDMDTGDVVDIGGDPYDFGNMGDNSTANVVVMEDNEMPTRRKAHTEASV